MQVDDLLAAIADRERLAQAAAVHGESWHTSSDGDVHATVDGRLIAEGPHGLGMVEGPHIAAHDPEAVIRSCRRDVDLVNLYTGALFTQSCHPEYEGNNGYVMAMEHVIQRVAADYRVSVEARGEPNMTETTLPPVDSRWCDTAGIDGTLTVVGHSGGYVVCTSPEREGEGWIHPRHFGDRYQPAE